MDKDDLGFKDGQMLTDAHSVSSTEREKTVRRYLALIDIVPPLGVELQRIAVKLLLVMIGYYLDCYL